MSERSASSHRNGEDDCLPAPEGASPQRLRFETRSDVVVDVAVVVVTFESQHDVGPLLADLRQQLEDVSMRVVFVDNASADASHELVARHPDVLALESGTNLGYGAAINLGYRRVGACEAVVVMNPDLRLAPATMARLLACQRATGAGAVVPAIVDEHGLPFASIRLEPSVTRAVGDALLGSRWGTRPRWARETEYDPSCYQTAHAVDWATGAVVLVSHAALERVGPWEETFFLYSEETDYMRRVRAAGLEVWFEPAAVVTHRSGGSGASPELVALLNVNRVRYFRAHHGRVSAQVFRAACVLGAMLRVWQPGARRSLSALLSVRGEEVLVEHLAQGTGPL